MKSLAASVAISLLLAGSALADDAPLPSPYGKGNLAKVGKDFIMTADVEKRLAPFVPGLRNAYPDQLEPAYHKLFDDTLVLLVQERVFEQWAAANSLSVTEADIDDAEELEIRESPAKGDREEFKKLLAQSNHTIAMFREEMRRSLIEEKVVQNNVDPEEYYVSPEEVRAAYAQNPKEFDKPERVKPLVLILQAADPRFRDRGREFAESLRRQLDAGVDYKDLLRWYGSDPEAPLPEAEWRLRGELDKPLEEAVFAAVPGSVVGPVEGREGWYFASVEAHEPASKVSFDDAQLGIERTLKYRKYRQLSGRVMVKLLQKAYIELSPQLPEDLKARLGQ